MEDKKSYRIVYIYGYLIANVLLRVMNSYLPIYYLNIIGIPKQEVANVLFLALLTQGLKPFLSIYLDKKPQKTRIMIMATPLFLVTSIVFFFFTLASVILFAIFLTTSLTLMFFLDVGIDKYIVAVSPTEEIKNKNSFYTQVGATLGTVIMTVAFMAVMNDYSLQSNWNLLFSIAIGITIFFIPISLILRNARIRPDEQKQEIEINFKRKLTSKPVVLMSIFLFLYTGDALYDWVLESWIVTKFGASGFSLFNSLAMIWIAFTLVGYIIAKYKFKKSKTKTISYTMFVIGILYIIAPFTDFMTMFVCFTFVNLLAGFILIKIFALMIEISERQVTVFQLMAAFTIIARISLTSLGLSLYVFLPGEVVIAMGGVLFVLAGFPLLFLKEGKY